MENAGEKRFEKDGLVFFGRMAEVASQMDDAEMDFFRLCDNISDQIVDYMETEHVSKAELAKRMKNSRAFITKILSGDMNVTLKTLTKILHHLGLKAEVKLIEKDQHVFWIVADSDNMVKDASFLKNFRYDSSFAEKISYGQAHYQQTHLITKRSFPGQEGVIPTGMTPSNRLASGY